MRLVTFLLKASGKVVGSSKEEIKKLFEVACNNGYELPENSIHPLMHGE